jgi:hypothetical protein
MPRLHRICLISLLYNKNLIENTYYSFYDNDHIFTTSAKNNIQLTLSNQLSQEMFNSIENLRKVLPLRLTLDDNATNLIHIPEQDNYLYENSYFSVICETDFFKHISFRNFTKEANESICLTEKTFNAIAMKHPFLVVGRPGSLKHLRLLGYQTFNPLINESYDDIIDDEARLLAIVDEIERLYKLSEKEWLSWQAEISSIVEHNYRKLKDYG